MSMIGTFPPDARPAVKASPDMQLIVSDYFVPLAYNPLAPNSNVYYWYLDLHGPHGFIDESVAGALPPFVLGGQGGGAAGPIPTLGQFLYVYAWTDVVGGQIRLDLANYAPNLTPTWWNQLTADVMPSVGFQLNAFEITTSFARITLTSTQGIVAIWLSIHTSSSRV